MEESVRLRLNRRSFGDFLLSSRFLCGQQMAGQPLDGLLLGVQVGGQRFHDGYLLAEFLGQPRRAAHGVPYFLPLGLQDLEQR